MYLEELDDTYILCMATIEQLLLQGTISNLYFFAKTLTKLF